MLASAILNIPTNKPERLFSGDKAKAEQEFRRLAAQWHPDKNSDPQAGDVFTHVNVLFDNAMRRLANGTWVGPSRVYFADSTGEHTFSLEYLKSYDYELGQAYISTLAVTYTLRGEHARRGIYAADQLRQLRNASPFAVRWVGDHKDCLPVLTQFLVCNDMTVLRLTRPNGFVRLRDVWERYHGKLPAEHVAWILSRLYNFACFLYMTDLVHCDLSLDTVYINPIEHSIAVLGGWWWSRRLGSAIRTLPARTVEHGPTDLRTVKLATHAIDSCLIRALGRELLGDISGSALNISKVVPKPFVQWLNGPGLPGNAVKEYERWYDKVLIDSFGAHRFVPMTLPTTNIYKDL